MVPLKQGYLVFESNKFYACESDQPPEAYRFPSVRVSVIIGLFVSAISYKPLVEISPNLQLSAVWDKDKLIRF